MKLDIEQFYPNIRNRHQSTIAACRGLNFTHLVNGNALMISRDVCELAAKQLIRLPDGPELTLGLQRLREAKDRFVTAYVQWAEDSEPATSQMHRGFPTAPPPVPGMHLVGKAASEPDPRILPQMPVPQIVKNEWIDPVVAIPPRRRRWFYSENYRGSISDAHWTVIDGAPDDVPEGWPENRVWRDHGSVGSYYFSWIDADEEKQKANTAIEEIEREGPDGEPIGLIPDTDAQAAEDLANPDGDPILDVRDAFKPQDPS